MRVKSALLGLLLAGCVTDDGTAWWAVDSMFMVPASDGATGTVSWNLYSRKWGKRFAPKHYLCAVVASFDAVPSATDCEGCVVAFDVDPFITASDCPESTTDPTTADLDTTLWTSTRRIGIGALGDGPYPDASSASWVDYGAGWERHGWAHPEAVATGGQAGSFTWDGVEPFSFTATSAWQLRDVTGSGLTPQSRSALEPTEPR